LAVLSALEPKAVFRYFEKLCAVPHGSRNTKQISDLCVSFARELGLKWRQDEANNVVIWKHASPGYEDAGPVILQGHMDMVCVKTEDCAKDMAREGLDLRTDGEWVWADKTSLGGDDGIALAMILAILADNSLPHPPLEAVFTVDEEVGMDGAAVLDCSDLKGRKLVNLDSEEEGIFTVSCAGGARLDCFLPGRQEGLDGEVGFAVTLDGLLGGHSGTEIHKGRASANHLMGRVLYSVLERVPGLRLAGVQGGTFDNVICPQCRAEVALPQTQAADFQAFVREFDAVLKDEYTGCDGEISLRCEPCRIDSALSGQDTLRMLRTLMVLPQGVQTMSAAFPGLVQTSLNLGILALEEDGLHFSISVRSSVASQKEMLVQKICAAVGSRGTVTRRGDYPGWPYAVRSVLRDDALAAYKAVTGKEGKLEAIHAGLECGLFVSKLPGLDAISTGPDIQDIHSYQERLSVTSTQRVYEMTCELLRRSK